MQDTIKQQPSDGPEQGQPADMQNSLEPALQRQVDENLQLLYRSKLEETLPESLQVLVRKLLDEGKTS
ncbi:hypothetical protein [Castellaniella sp.]|uniref:hypothetical protein n=1 Tax=Castellaniella sp. TaxID=1955812 RepID=UPI002AFDEC8A|nr:hypothetical protein [Castellaniella sp.]